MWVSVWLDRPCVRCGKERELLALLAQSHCCPVPDPASEGAGWWQRAREASLTLTEKGRGTFEKAASRPLPSPRQTRWVGRAESLEAPRGPSSVTLYAQLYCMGPSIAELGGGAALCFPLAQIVQTG